MDELTIAIDSWGHKELEGYLLSLNGIYRVKIKDDDKLYINLRYDSKLITPKIIKMEILLFLDIARVPSIYSFDKHSKHKTLEYRIIRDDVCCEYCFRGTIEDLFDIDGIKKVESNFDKYYSPKDSIPCDKIEISVEYDPDILSLEDMKKIETDLNL